MKRELKITLSVILISFVIVISVILVVYYLFSSGMCKNTTILSLNSPDKKHKAVLFERNCGATTDLSSQVSILQIDDNLENDESGNVFTSDSDHGNAPRALWDGPEVKIAWLNSDTLLISYHHNARVFLQKEKNNSIAILYETFE